jgi:SAM-dependent methyltransferase
VRVTVVDGTAEHLPAPDGSSDAVVVCLVLCSVRDQVRALTEFRRVLRPGGELRYYEHVRSRKAAIAATQRAVDRLGWPLILGGCHTARDTPAAIAAAGFTVERETRMWVGPRCALPVGTHVVGRARVV